MIGTLKTSVGLFFYSGYIMQNLVNGFINSVLASTDTLYAAWILYTGYQHVANGEISYVELWMYVILRFSLISILLMYQV